MTTAQERAYPVRPSNGDALPALAELLLSTPSLEQFLDELAKVAAGSVTAAVSCGITLRRDRQPITVSSSDALGALADEMQYSGARVLVSRRWRPDRS